MTTDSLMGGTTPDTAPATPADAPAASAAAPTPEPAPAVAAVVTEPAAAEVAPVPAADAAPADGKKPDEEKPVEKPAGAPEKYDLKAPEGSTLNADVQSKFEGVARELNLSQEQAQKLVEVMQPQMAAAQQAHIEAAKTQWAEQSRADKEFGGEKFTENLAIAKKGMDAVATPELRTLLEQSGLGNHPEIIRAFFQVGKKISPAGFVMGGAPAGSRSAADVLYPSKT